MLNVPYFSAHHAENFLFSHFFYAFCIHAEYATEIKAENNQNDHEKCELSNTMVTPLRGLYVQIK